MKKIIFVVALFILKFHSFAQTNFIPGTVTKKDGNTITGEIDYRDWARSPKSISFKNSNGQLETFDAIAINSFSIIPKKETYISTTVQIDMTPDDPDKVLSETIVNPLIVENTVFMLQLIKHPLITLYEYTDYLNKIHFFYSRQNEKPVELIHHYLYVEGDVRLIHDTKYQQQIDEIISSCPTLSGKTRNLKYRESEIQAIIVQYLNCADPSTAVEVKKKESLPVKFGIVAGAMLNNYTVVSAVGWPKNGYKTNVTPVIGVSLDLGLSRSYERMHFINELVYKRYKTNNNYSGKTNLGYTYQRDLRFDFSYIQINTLARYVLHSKSPVKLFFDGGVQNAYIISEKQNTVHTSYSYGTVTDDVAVEDPRKYEISLLLGTGVAINKILLEFRYSYSPKAFSPSYDLDIKTQSLHLLATYQF